MLDQIRAERDGIDLAGWVLWYPTLESVRDEYDREQGRVRGPVSAIDDYVLAHPEHRNNLRWAIFNGASLGISLQTVDDYLSGRLIDYAAPLPLEVHATLAEREATYWRSFCRILAQVYLGRDLADEALATFTSPIRTLAQSLWTSNMSAMICARDLVSTWALALPST